MKRRSFLQGIAAAVFGCLGISKTKAGLDHLEGEPDEVISKGLTAKDICNEALDKIGERPADGKYLDADEVECLACGRMVPIEKGFFAVRDQIRCVCGNRTWFCLMAKVSFED